jgi:hypothetical protein
MGESALGNDQQARFAPFVDRAGQPLRNPALGWIGNGAHCHERHTGLPRHSADCLTLHVDGHGRKAARDFLLCRGREQGAITAEKTPKANTSAPYARVQATAPHRIRSEAFVALGNNGFRQHE